MRKIGLQLLALALAAGLYGFSAYASTTDIALTASGAANVTPGVNIVYTVTVSNSPTGTAGTVVLNFPVPTGSTFFSVGTTPSGWTPGALPAVGGTGNMTYTNATFAVGATAANNTFTFTVKSNPGAVPASNITFAPTFVLSGPTDSNSANNAPTVVTVVGAASADLQMSISAAATITAGSKRTVTVTVTNNGPSNTFNAINYVTIPVHAASLASFSFPPTVTGLTVQNQFANNGGNYQINFGDFPAGTTATIVFDETVPSNVAAGTSVSDTATLNALNPTADPNGTNNAPVTSNATVDRSADMKVTIAGATSVGVGNKRTLTVTVQNLGPSDTLNTINFITIPVHAANVATFSFPPVVTGPLAVQNQIANNGGNYQVNFGDFPAGTTMTIVLDENIPSNATVGSSVSDTVTIGQTSPNPDSSSINNTATSSATITNSTDVQVTMTSVAGPSQAQNRILSITVTNAGPGAAANVTLIKTAAASTVFSSFTQNSGPTFTGPTSSTTFTIASLASGASATFTYVEIPLGNVGTTVVDTVTVSTDSGTNINDPNTANNFATVTGTISSTCDVSVTMTGPTSLAIGSNAVYTITVTNAVASPATAYNLIVNSSFNASATPFFTVISQSQTSGTPAITFSATPGTSFSDTIAFLAPGNSVVFQVTLQLIQTTPSGTPISLSATAAVNGSNDSNTANNTSTPLALVPVVQSEISIVSITPSPTPLVAAGGTLTYTIAITNTGPTNARNVSFTTTTPANTTFASIAQLSAPAGTAFTFTTPAVGAAGNITTAPIGFPTGTTVTITLGVTVNSNAPVGTVLSFTASATPAVIAEDPTPANNSLTNTTVSTIISSDITITGFTASPPANVTPAPTATIAYSFVVTNTGPSSGTGVSLSNTIPAGTTFKSLTQNGTLVTPSVAGAVVTFSIGAMNSAASLNFVLTINVPPNVPNNTVLLDSASVSSTSNDINLGNNSSSASVTAISSSDVSVTIFPSTGQLVTGSNNDYAITVSNLGPSDAQNLSLTFNMDPITSFVSLIPEPTWTVVSKPAVGAMGGQCKFSVGSLAAGAKADFLITVNVAVGLININIAANASVSSSTADAIPANNTATSNLTVVPVPSVTIDDIAVTEGDSGTVDAVFTISLSGPAPQLAVVTYETVDGTATSPSRYQHDKNTVVFFPPNDIKKTVAIKINSDRIVEATQAFSVILSKPAGVVLGAKTQGTCTILDNDIGGSLEFAVTGYTANENAGNATVVLSRSGGAAAAVKVDYATSDGTAIANVDYVATSGTVTFDADETQKSFTIPLLNKYGAIPDATLNLTLANPQGGGILGAQTTATLTIKAAPAISSGLLANGQIGSAFTYAFSATGQTPIVYTVPDPSKLPPGLFFSAGYITGTPTSVGSFTVPISATNAVGVDIETLTIVIAPLPSTPGAPGTEVDSDGDGFSDELEKMAGTDPLNALSTPVGNAPAQVLSISNAKLAIALNFAKKGNDSILFSGAVTLPDDFDQSGRLVYLDVAGVIRRFALDADGKGVAIDGTLKFARKRSTRTRGASQNVTFSLSIKKANLAETLAAAGLTNGSFVKVPRTIPVQMLLSTTLYKINQPQLYTAKPGKSGKTKNP